MGLGTPPPPGPPEGNALCFWHCECQESISYVVPNVVSKFLHDRTAYGSHFARPDKLWFRHRVGLVDFEPQKGVKSAPSGQIMLPEPDIFSFTTHPSFLVELPLRPGRRPWPAATRRVFHSALGGQSPIARLHVSLATSNETCSPKGFLPCAPRPARPSSSRGKSRG